MKRYSTSYFRWTFDLLMNLFLVGVLIYAINFGVTYHKKYSMDYAGYSVAFVAGIVLGLFLWETIVIIDFLVKDVKAQVTIDKENLTIIKAGSEEIFSFKDLVKIELSGPRSGSRSVTASLTYCKMTFKKRTIFLTSFTIHNNDIMKNLGLQVSKTRNRDRRFFELIK